MVRKPVKHLYKKQTNSKIYVRRSLTLPIFCFMLIDYASITSLQCFYWLVVGVRLTTLDSMERFPGEQKGMALKFAINVNLWI